MVDLLSIGGQGLSGSGFISSTGSKWIESDCSTLYVSRIWIVGGIQFLHGDVGSSSRRDQASCLRGNRRKVREERYRWSTFYQLVDRDCRVGLHFPVGWEQLHFHYR